MSDATQAPPARRRHLWGCLVLVLLLAALVVLGRYVYSTVIPDWVLGAAIAEADRLDPGWRLSELEAGRAEVPDRENSALQVLAVSKLMPAEFASSAEFADLIRNPEIPPEVQLEGKQITALRGGLGKAAAALPEGRKLAGMPRGRYAITYSPDFLSTDLDHLQEAHGVADLLWLDALLQAQNQDTDGALVSTRAVLNVGRSIGDEPIEGSQLRRVHCRILAVRSLERTLAQGEPSPAALQDFQRLLEEEDRHPALLVAVRGERAGYDQLLENFQSGKVGPADLAKALRLEQHEHALLTLTRFPGDLKRQRADLLHRMTQFTEIAKLPVQARQGPIKQWDRAVAEAEAQAQIRTEPGRPVLLALLQPAPAGLANACQCSSALLRCSIISLAAERYRRGEGRWPDSPATLVKAGYLGEVPADPYDGAPLRFRPLADGVVIYSIGRDLADNGGKLDRKNPLAPDTDLGFRLWDVSRRRQPPAPPKPLPPAEEAPAEAAPADGK